MQEFPWGTLTTPGGPAPTRLGQNIPYVSCSKTKKQACASQTPGPLEAVFCITRVVEVVRSG